MPEEQVEAVARRLYRETAEFYREIEPSLGAYALGFKILYGPPLSRPPVMFVGFQPAGDAVDRDREILSGAHDGWPAVCEYATASWKLAANMQRMFGPEFLRKSTGLNAIFVRAESSDAYAEVPVPLRRDIAAFCLPRASQMVDAVNPKSVVFIGFDALRLYGPSTCVLRSPKGRGLVEEGTVAGRPALGTLHLTGAQISTEDRRAIAKFVLDRCR